jgi:O-antigen/teichoic acid export membrane protein
VRDSASNALQATGRFMEFTAAIAASAAVAVMASWALCRVAGVEGALAGTILGELVLAGILWARVHIVSPGQSDLGPA